jgi:hypothetical protein
MVTCTGGDVTLSVFRRDPRFKPFIERLRKAVRLPPGTPNPYW